MFFKDSFSRLLPAVLMCFPTLQLSAQSTEEKICDFETPDSYASLGAYDTWENSPFHKSKIGGYAQVADNHLRYAEPARGYAPNPSRRILALRRSRYGSNTFGALIGLAKPFAQTKQPKYIHVKIYSPKPAPVMLIGLGNRDDRPGQPSLTEQFWSHSPKPIVSGKWNDVVFPVSGAEGVTIRHLLVVPDVTSPHYLKDDFMVYIDDIVMSDDPTPFFTTKVNATGDPQAKANTAKLDRGIDGQSGGGLNGDILFADGKVITGKTVKTGQPFRVKAVPAPGFRFAKLVIIHGAMGAEESATARKTVVTADKFRDGAYTIPASVVDGDLTLIPYFSSSDPKK